MKKQIIYVRNGTLDYANLKRLEKTYKVILVDGDPYSDIRIP